MVVGAPQTLSADVRWNRWLRWVRDNESFLAPEALLLTEEERVNGTFDTKLVVRDFYEQQRGLASAAVAVVDPKEELTLAASEWQDMSEGPTEDGDEEANFWS